MTRGWQWNQTCNAKKHWAESFSLLCRWVGNRFQLFTDYIVPRPQRKGLLLTWRLITRMWVSTSKSSSFQLLFSISRFPFSVHGASEVWVYVQGAKNSSRASIAFFSATMGLFGVTDFTSLPMNGFIFFLAGVDMVLLLAPSTGLFGSNCGWDEQTGPALQSKRPLSVTLCWWFDSHCTGVVESALSCWLFGRQLKRTVGDHLKVDSFIHKRRCSGYVLAFIGVGPGLHRSLMLQL